MTERDRHNRVGVAAPRGDDATVGGSAAKRFTDRLVVFVTDGEPAPSDVLDRLETGGCARPLRFGRLD